MTTLYKVTQPSGRPWITAGITYKPGKTYRRRNFGKQREVHRS